ncbi:DUF3991 domain-containing protein [Enterococcus gilvus]|uniref:DUF3991 domain-containing protein n=1 Tax=Enterococcus gilvus TaxID=160453 RepID=UPI0028D28086|nr:DUF3991 domain-containing protein [Enterococcus gilvus]
MERKRPTKVDRCKEIDIVDFARSKGLGVTNKGRDYRLEDHDSFVFDRRKQRFYWNSQGISGDIIELSKLFFVDESIKEPKERFQKAVDVILNEGQNVERVSNLHFEREDYKHHPEDYCALSPVGWSYLTETRKIPVDVVKGMEMNGLILEMKPKSERRHYIVKDDRLDNAIVFLWRDQTNQDVTGATYQGTEVNFEKFPKRGTYKHIDKDPTPNEAFNWKFGSPKHLKFFESGIDLASYVATNRKELKDTWLISMDGVKQNVVAHYFGQAVQELSAKEEFPKTLEICVDNDVAGQRFFERVHRLGNINPFTGEIVQCKAVIPNDLHVPKEFKDIYERIGKEYQVSPQAIMAIHKAENNLSKLNQLATTKEIQAIFGKKLEAKEAAKPIDLEVCCKEAAEQLGRCKKKSGDYDFDQFYKNKGGPEAVSYLSVKAENYYTSYRQHQHEFVSEVKKDWNDQLNHEQIMKEKRIQERQKLFQRQELSAERS